jgi:hypothetical protein
VAKKCHTTRIANKTRNNICCPIPMTLFLCGQSVHLCLPQAWKGIFTVVFLVPDMDIITEDQDFPLPLAFDIKGQSRLFPC